MYALRKDLYKELPQIAGRQAGFLLHDFDKVIRSFYCALSQRLHARQCTIPLCYVAQSVVLPYVANGVTNSVDLQEYVCT